MYGNKTSRSGYCIHARDPELRRKTLRTTAIRIAFVGTILALSCWLQAQTFTVLHAFNGPPSDGANPFAPLISDGAGNFYGAAETGGASCCGTIFRLNKSGEKTLYNFTGGADGGFPGAGLIRDAAGNLYGTTQHGERSGVGTIFKLSPTGQLTTLYQFTGGSDGGYPLASLIRDAAGNFYGTASSGGDLSCNQGIGCGVVFKLDTTGKETVLYSFNAIGGGQFPVAGLIRDAAGNLYGTTPSGGDTTCNSPFGCGVVFRLDANGKETVLHKFAGGTADGSFPESGLIRDAHGNLYGTTSEGGGAGCFGAGCGIVYSMNKNVETILYRFTGSGGDGSYPDAKLYLDAAGNFYGTTEFGGDTSCNSPFGCGTVFKLDSTGQETVIHIFNRFTDGGAPIAPLIADRAGNLYGTTLNWGPSNCNQYGCGTVFKIAP